MGRIVRPPYFIDRADELDRLVHVLGSLGENQVVIALRRMGKSSLLDNVMEGIRASYPETLPAYIDCRRVTSFASFVDEVVNACLGEFRRHHPVEAWLRLKARLVRDRISDLLPDIEKVGGSVGNVFSAYVAFREKKLDDQEFVARAFQFLEEFTQERNVKMVLILDEFQELEKLKTPLLFQLFKSYGDRMEKVRFCFSGSSVSVLQKIFLQPDSPLYLMAGKVPLDPLPEDVVAEFVRERFQAAGMTIEEGSGEESFALSGGIPYYVQKIGLNAWLRGLRTDRRVIMIEDVRGAFEDMIWELGSEFETRFEHKFGAAQKAILIALAVHGPMRRNDIAEQTGRQTGQISGSLTALEGFMEIQKIERGTYRICDPVFASWIRKRIGTE